MKVWALFFEEDEGNDEIKGLFLQLHKAQEEAEETYMSERTLRDSANFQWSTKRYLERRPDSGNWYLHVKDYRGDWRRTGAYLVLMEVAE